MDTIVLFHGIVLKNYPITIKCLCELAPETSQCLYHWERDRNGVVNIRHLHTEIVYYPADLWRLKWMH